MEQKVAEVNWHSISPSVLPLLFDCFGMLRPHPHLPPNHHVSANAVILRSNA